MDERMSTTIQRSFYRSGQVREEVPVRNGQRHGIVRAWHKNGQLASEEHYQNGLLHGVCRQWDDAGKLLGEYRMDHGTGIQRVWFENGKLQWEQSFVNGKATGPCRMWLQDGTFATEQWLIENREVSQAQFAKIASQHPEWPKHAVNGKTHRNLAPTQVEKRAYRLQCEWLLGKTNTKDAAKWLEEAKSGAHVVGPLSGRRARKVVNDAIAAGAVQVLAADIYGSKEGREFADVLLVKLPKSRTHRESVRKVFRSLARPAKCAVQPDEDHGNQWLYVYLG